MTLKLNPDKEIVAEVRQALKENEGYCPCRIQHNAANKCICEETKQMMQNNIKGLCHCGLYLVEEN